MGDIFDDTTQKIIGQMISASRSLPEDFFLVPAMQELAGVVARNGTVLSSEDLSLLIGVGAVIIRESRAEMTAQIQAAMAIANARGNASRAD